MIPFSRFGSVSLIGLLAVTLGLSWLVVQPFLLVIALSVVITTVFHPLYVRLARRLAPSWAALVSVLAVALCIVLPISGVIWLLAEQSATAFVRVQDYLSSDDFARLSGVLQEQVHSSSLQGKVTALLMGGDLSLLGKLAQVAQRVSMFVLSNAGALLSSGASIIVNVLIMMLTMFYLFRDGVAFRKRLFRLMPLSAKYEKEIARRFSAASHSVIFGTFLTAAAQGILGAMGFAMAGLPAAIWGALMAFFALMPFVGAGIIWLPAAIFLILTGQAWAGVFLLAWGGLVVSSVDNLLRPLLMQGKMEMHPLIIFFALIGGIAAFGFVGIFFGPLIMVIAATMLHIYELEYAQILDAEDRDA